MTPLRERLAKGERWRNIIEYPGYQASDQGRIRGVERYVYTKFLGGNLRRYEEKILATTNRQTKYLSVSLIKNERKTQAWVHRLVWSAFYGPIPEKMEINHVDCNTKNNSLSNLELCTKIENLRHARSMGRMRRSSRHLSDLDVTVIRLSKRTSHMLGRLFKISPDTVKTIRSRKTLAYIKDIAI